MHIDWAALVEVAVVAAAVAVTVVLLVSFGLVGLSVRAERDSAGDAETSHAHAGTAVAVLCIGAACLIVGYGLHLIVA